METSLHRQLKSLYAPDAARQEVVIDGYRIDAVVDGRLVEIQYGSLGAIRDKVAALLANHDVHVVKPLAARKYLITRDRANGPVKSARYSPSRETCYDLFVDLVHFVNVFPHSRLTLEVVLTEQEESRVRTKRRWWRQSGFRVTDRALRHIHDRREFRTAHDLAALLPADLASPFSTDEIARGTGIPRWVAQKMAYCLRTTGAIKLVGKHKNALLYERAAASAKRPRRAA